MKAEEFVKNFIHVYETNQHKLDEWNDKLFTNMTISEWARLIKERSGAIRGIYKENEKLLQKIWQHIPAILSKEEVNLLYELSYNIFSDNYHDFFILTRIGELILPYYESEKDYTHMLHLYHMLGYEYTIFYRLIQDSKGAETALDYYRKSIALKEHYAELPDLKSRQYIFLDYGNLCAFLKHFHATDFKEVFDLVDEAWKFAQSDIVLAIDKEEPQIAYSLAKMDRVLLEMAENIQQFDEGDSHRIAILINRIDSHCCKDTNRNLFTYLLAEHLKGNVTEETMVSKLISQIVTSEPEIDYTDNTNTQNLKLLIDYMNLIIRTLSFLQRSNLSQKRKDEYLSTLLPLSQAMITNIPYRFHTEVMNSVCAEWYTVVEPYLLTEEDKIRFLLQLIIRRQPITYIHSMMVSKIAIMLAEEVFKKCPQELVGILNCKNKKEVQKKKDQILNYISSCGLLHDVGKCFITDIINKQNRMLSPLEFTMIKLHPTFGASVAKQGSILEPYYDIILGHHKTYDGKAGYPEDFDNTGSSVRFIIDLISIADSIDAATDILGRNYTDGKDFATLFQELKEGAGTQYNPVIVQLIENNDILWQKLATLTTGGRYEIYYQAYKDILKG